LALYLFQFHPIAENAESPNLPGELGFCDLRLAETRAAQADLASAAGIEGSSTGAVGSTAAGSWSDRSTR
jgi:hypothetical protein